MNELANRDKAPMRAEPRYLGPVPSSGMTLEVHLRPKKTLLESGSSKVPEVPCKARCKVQAGGSWVLWCRPSVKFKEGSENSGVVWCRPLTGLVQARCKVQESFRRLPPAVGDAA